MVVPNFVSKPQDFLPSKYGYQKVHEIYDEMRDFFAKRATSTYQNEVVSKLKRSELWKREVGHMVKTWLQLMCCTLVWELGCLGILESQKERVSGKRCGTDGET